METITITAEARATLRKGLGALRRNGYLPAIIYGAVTEPIPVQLHAHHTSQILNRLQGTALIELNLDGEVYQTVVREIQRDVLTGNLLHVDLMAVAMDQVISMTVPIQLVGDSPATSTGEFAIIPGTNEVEVECLPEHIISSIEVSVEALSELGNVLTIADLVIPAEITVLTDVEEVIARVAYAGLAEEEEEEEMLEIDAEDVEVIDKRMDTTEEDASVEESGE